MKNGKKKKIGMIPETKAIGPMIKTGMMAIGPQKNCTTRMSMVIPRRKAKERKPARLSYRNKETGKRFPGLVGEVDALQRGLQRRPDPVPREVGLQPGEASWRPWEKGASFFTTGFSDQTERPDQFECSEQTEVPSDKKTGNFNQQSTALTKQRNQLRRMVSFPFIPSRLIHVIMDYHFTQRIQHLQLYAFTRAMGSRKTADAFCRYVGSHPNSGLWNEIQPTSSRFFFANSQQPKCTEKIVILMHDH